MTAELFLEKVGTIYNGFFDENFYQTNPPPPLHPRVAGSKTIPVWLGINKSVFSVIFVHIRNSKKRISNDYIKAKRKSFFWGSFLIIQELNKRLSLFYKMFKFQFFSILTIETRRQTLIVKV